MEPTGWKGGLLQDVCRKLSIWLSTRPGARRQAQEAAQKLAGSTNEGKVRGW